MQHAAGSEAAALAEQFVRDYKEQSRLFVLCNEYIERGLQSQAFAVGDSIELSTGDIVDVVDNFAKSNVQWRPAPIRRVDLNVRK